MSYRPVTLSIENGVGPIMRVNLPVTQAQMSSVEAKSYSTRNIGTDGFPAEGSHKFFETYIDVNIPELVALMEKDGTTNWRALQTWAKAKRAEFPAGSLDRYYSEDAPYEVFGSQTNPTAKAVFAKIAHDILTM